MKTGFEIPITVRLSPRERFEITSFCASQIRKLAKGLPEGARKQEDENEIEFFVTLHDKIILGNEVASRMALKRKNIVRRS